MGMEESGESFVDAALNLVGQGRTVGDDEPTSVTVLLENGLNCVVES
jgi:hypothetical protein